MGDVEAGGAAHHHVLADGGDQIGDQLRHRLAAGGLGAGERIHAAFDIEGGQGHLAGGVLEQLVAGDEIGLGVQFDDRPGHARAVVAQRHSHEAFCGHAVGLLGRLGQTLGAQPVHGGFDVALGLLQGLLAIHHACA